MIVAMQSVALRQKTFVAGGMFRATGFRNHEAVGATGRPSEHCLSMNSCPGNDIEAE
jgi:hypothetical protein